ncbi:efflux RND transporter periplasmic adaptor subunit [Riemerella columbipharyngis]|uniref:RND family efflux transporter, MFP subunit n=1 Tax=Riemerella columbipharyngis TaxID=1071918 RepID=A0A1G7DYK5_9FLAO|nr:efflux RND transporter periplasmic adaptor subunit [Riemerella columbipharyngis]SDE56563.1 RND family efflux transporter, MFP subunit [Riemerella columbipharyngis]
MSKKSILSILVVAAVAAGLFFILRHNKKNNENQVAIVAQENASVAVKAEPAKIQEIAQGFSVNGNFIPKTEAQIAAEMGGQLVALYVQEGSYVKAGQVVARLKGDKIDVGLNNAKANLAQAQSALQRFEAAYKTGGVTALQLDQARLQVKNARAQVQSAQLQSGDTNVISKVSGIVSQKMVELGSVVGAGTPIVKIVDISSLKLKVDVDERVVSTISVGQTATVQPSVSDTPISGKITYIAPVSNGGLKFPVEITVPNDLMKLKAGMYATADFDANQKAEALVIPRSAFVGGVSSNMVFVVKDNVAYLTKVKSGTNYGDEVQILDGLNSGDMVVTSGQINLSDKTKVSIIK